jgi:hypothetical protein
VTTPTARQIVVFIARVAGSSLTGGSFAELEAISSDSVARLAERACTKFSHWKVAADEVKLFAVAKAGRAPSDAEIDAALLRKPLSSFDTLAEAGLVAGSCLLARVPPPPTAEPGASRRRRAESDRSSRAYASLPYRGQSLQSGNSMLRYLSSLLNFIRLQLPRQLRRSSVDSQVRSLLSLTPCHRLLTSQYFPFALHFAQIREFISVSPEISFPLPRSVGKWMTEKSGRRQAGSLLLFGAWEIISSLLLAETKLNASKALVALSLLSLAFTTTERASAMILALSILCWLLMSLAS